MILSAFGDKVEGNGNAAFIKYLFENERLPIELGWQPPTSNMTLAGAQAMAALKKMLQVPPGLLVRAELPAMSARQTD